MPITKEEAEKTLESYRISYSKGSDKAFVPYLVLDSFLKGDLPRDDYKEVVTLVQKLSDKVFNILQTRHSVKGNLENKKNLKVCHYTKYEHLENMLKDKEARYLRMYNVRYCNDPTEGNYFFDQADEKSALYYFKQQRASIKSSQEPLVSTYILSLCSTSEKKEKEDNLNLWNLHGHNGHGVCLKFEIPTKDLGDSTIKQSHTSEILSSPIDLVEKSRRDEKIVVYDIIYKDGKNNQKEYEATVNDLEKELAEIKKFVEDQNNDNYKRVVCQIVLAVLGSLPYLYKDEFYEYEKECRIIRHFLPEDKKLEHDERYKPPRLYYETQLGLLEVHDEKNPCTIILGYAIEDKEGTRDYLAHQLRKIAEDKPIPAITFSRLRY